MSLYTLTLVSTLCLSHYALIKALLESTHVAGIWKNHLPPVCGLSVMHALLLDASGVFMNTNRTDQLMGSHGREVPAHINLPLAHT